MSSLTYTMHVRFKVERKTIDCYEAGVNKRSRRVVLKLEVLQDALALLFYES